MPGAEIYRRKSDDLLREATRTSDLGERSRLISEAVHWNMMANTADEAHAPEQIDEQPAALPDEGPPLSRDP